MSNSLGTRGYMDHLITFCMIRHISITIVFAQTYLIILVHAFQLLYESKVFSGIDRSLKGYVDIEAHVFEKPSSIQRKHLDKFEKII